MRWYADDQDRSLSYFRNNMGLKFVWEHWFEKQHRMEAGLDISHELETGFSTGMLVFRFHFGGGRGYRDFLPGEIAFDDLKERLIPHGKNNRIIDGKD
ncbi:MAG: hypothetical protein HN580_15805 [Deltaproteobacteria bacterium]|nr:hypothetical protein [Deltaproteobacteria bacterium]